MNKKFKERTGFDLAKINKEVLAEWDSNNIEKRSITEREGHPQYTFYEGPPSANGHPGIHHVLARTIKDTVCRYKTMKGFCVPRKAGWDTHGLPVELGVEKELGITKEDIGKTISIEEYNDHCRKNVMKYTAEWEDLSRKMGYWVDMAHPYITYENYYIESVWWLLAQMYKKGLVYKGYTIQPYSPAAGTGLSSHELSLPGCYRDVKDTTVTAQFKIVNPSGELSQWGTAYFLAWTTTPWTLASNTALCVGPNIDYVTVRTYNPYTGKPVTVIMAEERLAAYLDPKGADIPLEDYKKGDKVIPYSVVAKCKGTELEGMHYEQLMPYVNPGEGAFRVILGDYVTTEDGTGIVHIAPTFGADDAFVAKAAGVPIISSMGAGNKMDSTAFEVADIYETSVCPLAKVMRQHRTVFRVCRPLREKRIRRHAHRQGRDTRRKHLHGLEAERQGIQNRKTCALVPALLAHGQTYTLLSPRQLVHPLYGEERTHVGTEHDNKVEAAVDRNGPLRKMARKPERLEPVALTFLGHAASYMAQ